MPFTFDPNASATSDAGGDFPGTGANTELYKGISRVLEVHPVHISEADRSIAGDFAGHRGASGPGSEPTLVTVKQAMQGLFNMDPAGVLALQDRLVAAGALKEGKFVPGQVDNDTESAYADVVRRAALSQKSILGLLDESTKAIEAAGGLGILTGSKAKQTALTNSDDLRKVIEVTATKVYGHGRVDQAVIDRIVAGFHAAESGAQTSTASTVEQSPSPATYVENQLRASDPQAAQVQDTRNIGNEFFDLLAGTNG